MWSNRALNEPIIIHLLKALPSGSILGSCTRQWSATLPTHQDELNVGAHIHRTPTCGKIGWEVPVSHSKATLHGWQSPLSSGQDCLSESSLSMIMVTYDDPGFQSETESRFLECQRRGWEPRLGFPDIISSLDTFLSKCLQYTYNERISLSSF